MMPAKVPDVTGGKIKRVKDQYTLYVGGRKSGQLPTHLSKAQT